MSDQYEKYVVFVGGPDKAMSRAEFEAIKAVTALPQPDNNEGLVAKSFNVNEGIFDGTVVRLSDALSALAAARKEGAAEVVDWIESQYSGGLATTLAMNHARQHFDLSIPPTGEN